MLRAAGVDFDIRPAAVDEAAIKRKMLGMDAACIAQALADTKALAKPGDLVLGADSVVELDGMLIGKCASRVEAASLLSRLSGKTHRLVSAAALARKGEIVWRHLGEARLTMRALSEAFIADYLTAEGDALLACVGCYRLEGRGAQLFESFEGDYFSILGLPLLPLLAELRRQQVLGS